MGDTPNTASSNELTTRPLKLTVTPEGREGVWLADKDNVIAWIRSQKWSGGKIHNLIGGTPVLLGADWPVRSVISALKRCERLAVLTGDAQRQNMNHALAAIAGERLDMFDIGKIAESDLSIAKAEKSA